MQDEAILEFQALIEKFSSLDREKSVSVYMSANTISTLYQQLAWNAIFNGTNVSKDNMKMLMASLRELSHAVDDLIKKASPEEAESMTLDALIKETDKRERLASLADAYRTLDDYDPNFIKKTSKI